MTSNKVHDALDIPHTDGRRKHFHDVCSTYISTLVQLALPDQDSDIIGWSAQQANEIRKIHVEDVATDMALTER